MAKNFEVKIGPVDSLANVESLAQSFSESGPFQLQQTDVFFSANKGRLKLRIESRDGAESTGQLIAYQRPDQAEARISEYLLYSCGDAEVLEECLTRSLGVDVTVKKTRVLFLVGRARIHLDRVEGLGDFVEIEVVLTGDGQCVDDQNGELELLDLVEKLGLKGAPVLSRAYADMLRDRVAKAATSA